MTNDNALYGKSRQKFLDGDIDWTNDNIRVGLVHTAGYSVSIDSDEYLSSIPSSALVATSVTAVTKTSTLGVADAADITLSAVTGASCEAMVIFKDVGSTPASSPLIAYINTATGLPVTPNGGDITIQWAGTANKIFKL